MKTLRTYDRGFTLVELVVAVGILAIVSTLAISNYSRYVRRSNRVDATATLLNLQVAQEKFFLQNNTYAGGGLLTTAAPAGLGFGSTTTSGGNYTVSINLGAGGVSYVATAIPVSGKSQVYDTQCQRFSINQAGVKSAQDSGGSDTSTQCWR